MIPISFKLSTSCLFFVLGLALFGFNPSAQAQQTTPAKLWNPSDSDPDYDARKRQSAGPQEPPGNTIPKSINPIALPSCFEPFDNTGANGWAYIPRNDDGSVGPITLGWNFSLFGTIYNSVYINNNGNITFTSPTGQFTADGFPISTPMIAAFWADVDTYNTSSGLVWYKVFSDRLVVTWDRVGYFSSQADKRNTFQLIIKANTAPNFSGNDVIFAYGDMQWTTGSASGGTNGFGGGLATVGANRGTNLDYVQTGRFNTDGNTAPNSAFTGSSGGIDWLDGKCIGYQVRSGVGNLPPAVAGLPTNNQVAVSIGQSRTVTMQFSGPEPSQRVTVTPTLSGLCNVSATVRDNNTSNPTVTMVVRGNTCNQGTNRVVLTAVDSGTPSQTQAFTINVVVNSANTSPFLNYALGTINSFSAPTASNPKTLSIAGSGFTPNSVATLSISPPSGGSPRTFPVAVGPFGVFGYRLQIDNTFVSGKHTINCQDALGIRVPQPLTFTISSLPSSYTTALKINNVSTIETNKWQVAWEDVMFPLTGVYPTRIADRAYRYKIEYGAVGNSGQVLTWIVAGYWPNATTNGYALLNKTQSFIFSFNPTQALTSGNYAVRVTDELLNNRKVERQFQYTPPTVDDVAFVWDWPNRSRNNPVEGVAADSVGRFNIKISPVSTVVRVEVSLEDANGSYPGAILGKLMKANIIDAFSSEANNALAISATNTQPVNGNYWFWYVAPDNFTRGDNDNDKAERIVTLRVKYYNAAGTLSGQLVKSIKIVRPALMLVHGLGGDESTWDNFKHDGVFFKYDDRFKVVNVVKMYGEKSFNYNSNALLGLDSAKPSVSFTATLNQLRAQGFACNRVDYVAHSMGGCMLRNTLHSYRNQFYNTTANYGKGFVHKFITLDTPHQGSPLGDVVTEFAEYMNTGANRLLSWIPDKMRATFLQSSGNGKYKASGAVYDMGIRKGVRFNQANLNTHQIVGDYVRNQITPQYALAKAQLAGDTQAIALPTMADFLIQGAEKKFESCNCNTELDTLKQLRRRYSEFYLLDNIFTYKFLNWQANRVYPRGKNPFFENSDIIVSVESQSAGRIQEGTQSDPAVTVLTNANHNFKPDKVVGSDDAGNKVFELLNTPLSSPLFARTLPASPPISGVYGCDGVCPVPKTNNETLAKVNDGRIKILQPAMGASFTAMSAVPVSVSVADVTNLYYVQTDFQTYRAVDTTLARQITYSFQASPQLLGLQPIVATATYKLPTGNFTTSSDTVWVNIVTDVPLVSIETNKLLYDMAVGDREPISITAYHESFDRPVPYFDGSLSVVISNPNIVRYDAISGQFVARSAGQTSATATYQGKTTEILFNVQCTNIAATLSGSQTITAGQVVTLTAELSGGDGYTITLSDGQVFRDITESPFNFTVAPTTTTTYLITSVSAVCGTGTVSGSAVVTVNGSTACSSPANLTETNQAAEYVKFNWATVAGATGYQIRWKESTASTWNSFTTCCSGVYNTSVTYGKTYDWQVATSCSNTLISAFSSTRTFTMSCPLPFDLSEIVSGNNARLYWASMGYQGAYLCYTIRWRPVGTTTWSTKTECFYNTLLTNLSSGTTYEWQISTTCPGGTSSSAFTTSRMFTAGGCTNPSDVWWGFPSGTSIQLYWTFAQSNDLFEVQWRPAGSITPYSSMTVTALFGGRSLTGLTPATVYDVQVRSLCTNGQISGFSTPISVTTATSCTLPTATLVGSQTITSGQAAILTVTLTSSSPWSLTLSNGQSFNNINSSPFTFTVAPTTTTTYTLARVANACGSGGVSGTAVITVSGSTSCAAATNLYDYFTTPTVAAVAWTNPSTYTSTTVFMRAQGSSTWTSYSPPGNVQYFYSLTPGTIYEWYVASGCASGVPGISVIRSFTAQCTTPTQRSMQGISPTGASVSWAGVTTVSYQVRWKAISATTWIEGPVLAGSLPGVSNTTYNITGLLEGNAYEWQVRMVCSGTGTSYSPSLTFTTGCNSPTYMYADYSATSDNAATIYFQSFPSGTPFEVEYRPQGSTTTPLSVTTSDTQVLLTGLTANTTYEFRIRMICGAGQFSAFSGYNTFRTNATCATAMYTVQNGYWDSPSTWSCNRVPLANEVVEVRHIVRLSPYAFTGNHARQIRYTAGGRLIYEYGAKLKVGF